MAAAAATAATQRWCCLTAVVEGLHVVDAALETVRVARVGSIDTPLRPKALSLFMQIQGSEQRARMDATAHEETSKQMRRGRDNVSMPRCFCTSAE